MSNDNPIRKAIIEELREKKLTNQWQRFECKRDQFRDEEGNYAFGAWGSIINGKKVFVVLSYEGQAHNLWRLYIDDAFVRVMDEIHVHMGSGFEAMIVAEKEVTG
jgi:hypothetical protein